jgi:hypothetical protein
MSSSRSIAAARSRRSAETPRDNGRPVTSIASHSAFVPQPQPQPQINQANKVGKAPNQPSNSNKLPFSKLTVSDAIGLITLRLGRVEEFMTVIQNLDSPNNMSIPENSKIIDNSVLTSMINRLDSLEKRESSNNHEQMVKMEKELKETKELLAHFLYKFELFYKETNDKFGDFEQAFTEIEKNLEDHHIDNIDETISANIINESTNMDDSSSTM